jgi:hypothetical protein
VGRGLTRAYRTQSGRCTKLNQSFATRIKASPPGRQEVLKLEARPSRCTVGALLMQEGCDVTRKMSSRRAAEPQTSSKKSCRPRFPRSAARFSWRSMDELLDLRGDLDEPLSRYRSKVSHLRVDLRPSPSMNTLRPRSTLFGAPRWTLASARSGRRWPTTGSFVNSSALSAAICPASPRGLAASRTSDFHSRCLRPQQGCRGGGHCGVGRHTDNHQIARCTWTCQG